MNNMLMYDQAQAGGIVYDQTESYEYQRYYTTDGLTDTSEYKTIRFSVLQTNLFFHFRNAFLELRGSVVRKDTKKPFVKTDKLTFINNPVPHFFSNAKFSIGSRVVESINEFGHVSSLIHYTLLSRSKMKCGGLEFFWLPDTDDTATDANLGFKTRQEYLMQKPKTPGNFVLRIPLQMLFGVAENYVCLRGYPINIEFVRGGDHCALLRADDVAQEGLILFQKLTLNIPIVEPSNVITVETLRGLSDPKTYLYSFRRRSGLSAPVPKDVFEHQMVLCTTTMIERPQYIWVGFQKDLKKDQKQNYGIYWHGDVQQMSVEVNNIQFPVNPVEANFEENDTGFFYTMQRQIRENYLQLPTTYTEGSVISPMNYGSLFPIFAFDVSKHNFSVGARSVTTKLNMRFRTQVPANVVVRVAWFSDRSLELSTDGSTLDIKQNVDSYVAHD